MAHDEGDSEERHADRDGVVDQDLIRVTVRVRVRVRGRVSGVSGPGNHGQGGGPETPAAVD